MVAKPLEEHHNGLIYGGEGRQEGSRPYRVEEDVDCGAQWRPHNRAEPEDDRGYNLEGHVHGEGHREASKQGLGSGVWGGAVTQNVSLPLTFSEHLVEDCEEAGVELVWYGDGAMGQLREDRA